MDYVPHTEQELQEMLSCIGVKSTKELFSDIPDDLQNIEYKLPAGISEKYLVRSIEDLASKNVSVKDYDSYLGGGFYHHYIPAVVDDLSSRSEFYTAYTPYQPEVSQGTLQAIFEFQTLISRLTGMDVSNASLYDGASAAAEALYMSINIHKKRKKIVVFSTIHPEYIDVIRTYAQGLDTELVFLNHQEGTIDPSLLATILDENTAAVIVQQPNFFGCLEDVTSVSELTKQSGALFITICNPLSLGILEAPGTYDADIVIGEGQSLGNHLNFGGPALGFMACKKEYVRKMPGRIVGMTEDKSGRRGFVLTLQAREQHIRREKATSNICTNEALNALIATIYLTSIGPHGLRKVAQINAKRAHETQKLLCSISEINLKFSKPFFNEFVLESSLSPEKINTVLRDHSIIGGLPLGSFFPELSQSSLYCVTEQNEQDNIQNLYKILESLHG